MNNWLLLCPPFTNTYVLISRHPWYENTIYQSRLSYLWQASWLTCGCLVTCIYICTYLVTSLSGQDIFCPNIFDTLRRTSLRESKIITLARAQLTFQMVAWIKNIHIDTYMHPRVHLVPTLTHFVHSRMVFIICYFHYNTGDYLHYVSEPVCFRMLNFKCVVCHISLIHLTNQTTQFYQKGLNTPDR